MFFQRFFKRKNKLKNSKFKNNTNYYNRNMNNCNSDIENHGDPCSSSQIPQKYQQHGGFNGESIATSTPRHRSNSSVSLSHRQSSLTAIQLTPLWEHILRTRTLPEHICPVTIFGEFVERLRDPEWQVRQHALRVLVDVLAVMRGAADAYMEAVVQQLVENLGHAAPTVRKGALDCLRVYLTETSNPEVVLLNVLDIGLNQRVTNEAFGGRLTCGVLLSIPALLQCILETQNRNFILQKTINLLVEKMNPVTNQEIMLKVLHKIRQLIGDEDFIGFMSPNIFGEFEKLCHIYGVGEETHCRSNQNTNNNTGALSSWYSQSPNTTKSLYWRSCSEDIGNSTKCDPKLAKVIMETEIHINDDTLTMRLLETDEHVNVDESNKNLLENEIVYGNLAGEYRYVNSFSDSEMEDLSSRRKFSAVLPPLTPTRTPKRVTFGGEVVKVRTPDSDAASTNHNFELKSNHYQSRDNISTVGSLGEERNKELNSAGNANISSLMDLRPSSQSNNKTTELSVEIPSDNTQPLEDSTNSNYLDTESNSKTDQIATNISLSPTAKNLESVSSLSPRLSYKRLSISSIESNISPRAPHKEIEVLHNLQRDPSPARIKRMDALSPGAIFGNAYNYSITSDNFKTKTNAIDYPVQSAPPKSWEDLNIVDNATIMDLRSANWRDRLRGILELKEALSSTQTLSQVQACLDSLLRTLLSSERNYEVVEAKQRLLINLISRLPLDNLENRAVQIMSGLCRQGDPSVYSVCKALMQRLPPASIVLKLTSPEFLHARSSRFLEHALQIVIYALLTFPNTCFDTTTCTTNVTYAAFSRKRRVRQAALELLSLLARSVPSRSIMEVVQQIAISRDDGADLVAAVKARLSRKELPMIASDHSVQYGLNLQYDVQHNAQNKSQADVNWITRGIGSVSPTALRRRALKTRSISQQSFRCLPQQSSEQQLLPQDRLSNYSDDIYTRGKTFQGNYSQLASGHNDSSQYGFQQISYGNRQPMPYMAKKSNVSDNSVYPLNRRVFMKSCSDSSMDGRSTDSTQTTSSGEVDGTTTRIIPNDNEKATSPYTHDDVHGRFTRQQVNSRFPAMDMNFYARSHNTPYYYQGMGEHFAGLRKFNQPTGYNLELFTKKPMNYPITAARATHNRKKNQATKGCRNNTNNIQNEYAQDIFVNAEKSKERHVKHRQQSDVTKQQTRETIGDTKDDNLPRAGRRFVNGENFPDKRSKSSEEPFEGLPPSLRGFFREERKPSSTYSQKSTVSIPSSSSAQLKNTDHGQHNSENDRPPFEKQETEDHNTYDGEDNEIRDDDGISTIPVPSTTFSGVIKETALNVKANTESPKKWSLVDGTLVDELDKIKIDAYNSHEDDGHALERNESLASLQSKTESIKTQLEDGTPPVLSRAQSAKSLVIEEDIEQDAESIASDVADENTEVNMATNETFSEPNGEKMDSKTQGSNEKLNEHEIRSSRTVYSPTIDDLKKHSISLESLYNSMPSKNDFINNFSNTTSNTSAEETSSICSMVPVMNLPAKKLIKTNQPTQNPTPTVVKSPLKQKAKSLNFLRSKRRVSPAKQPMKLRQAELYPTTLENFEKPREAILQAFDQLDSTEWEVNMMGLRTLVRLIRHHPEQLENNMHMVCIQMTRSVRNLRSQVARAACQAAGELFTNVKLKHLEAECEDLISALLHRTADTNRFLRSDATKALESMCDSITPIKVLNVLATRGAVHQNSVVRTTTAKLMERLVDRLGYDKVYALPRDSRDKFFVTSANLLLEGSLETRRHAKSVFQHLAHHPSYEKLIHDVIPNRVYRNIEKTLKSIH